MFRILILAAILFFSSTVIAQNSKSKTAIQQVLDRQMTAWNKGDIAAFMEGYLHDEALTFVGSAGPQYGWQNTYKRYLRTYDSPEKMGTLLFDILKMEKLGRKNYLILGKWHLTRSVGDLGGTFTLIFRRIKGEWKIVYDHTS